MVAPPHREGNVLARRQSVKERPPKSLGMLRRRL